MLQAPSVRKKAPLPMTAQAPYPETPTRSPERIGKAPLSLVRLPASQPAACAKCTVDDGYSQHPTGTQM